MTDRDTRTETERSRAIEECAQALEPANHPLLVAAQKAIRALGAAPAPLSASADIEGDEAHLEMLAKHRVQPEWYRRGQSMASRILDREWQSKEDRRATLVVEMSCDIRDAVEADRAAQSSIAPSEDLKAFIEELSAYAEKDRCETCRGAGCVGIPGAVCSYCDGSGKNRLGLAFKWIELEKRAARSTSAHSALVAALERSVTALDDWLNVYASDLCDETRVKEAQERIGGMGTLAYIADVQQQNRNALYAVSAIGTTGK